MSFKHSPTFILTQNNSDEEDPYQYTGKVRVNLTHGSLLMMLGSLQKHWQHRVPKEYHDRESRINLTFRRMYPITAR